MVSTAPGTRTERWPMTSIVPNDILADSSAALSLRGREKIARRFSLDKAVNGYRAIIQQAVVRAKHLGTTRTESLAVISAMRVA